MSSPIHSKVLSRLSLLVPSVVLLCFSLTVRAELTVEWIDDNTIVVTGYGNGGGVTNENPLGSCTNCLAISPAEMHAIKEQIQNLLNSTLNDVYSIYVLCDGLDDGLDWLGNEISGFHRFGSSPNSGASTTDYLDLTNYVSTTDNTQTRLDLNQGGLSSVLGQSVNAATRTRHVSYNNGIYDYATSHVSPTVTQMRSYVSSARSTTQDIDNKLNSISLVVSSITEESCQSCGGGTNSSNCTSCPCEEQWDALLDYIRHIDEDQHKRFAQLYQVSNKVFNIDKQLDSYAKLVSGVLYQDGTIQLDDGESWTNVYFSGESENYHYDKSNILQRIELILFGMAHSTTNFTLEASSVTNELNDAAANNVTNQFNEFSSDSTNSFLNAKEKLQAKVNSIKSISAMFVFWGTAGSDSPFTLGYVPNLDGSGGGQYIEVGNGFLGTEVSRFRQLCRYGFQLIWATSFLFLIWLFYVRLFKYVVIFLKYAFEWINEAFAS